MGKRTVDRQVRRTLAYVLLLALALGIPYIAPNTYYLQVIIMGFILAIGTYGLNLILGYTGQLSLAHAGFFGIGAYLSGLLTLKIGVSFWLALPVASLGASFLGALTGLVSFRTRGHYFAIFTLSIGVIINLVIEKWDSVTGGVRGLIGIPAPSNLGPVSFDSVQTQYYLVLAFLLLTVLVISRVVHSLVGRTFVSVRSSEELAATIGINVMGTKLLSFAIATFLAGMAGALYAGYIRFIGPEVSHLNLTFDFLLYLLVGGQGTIAGPLLGSLLVSGITEGLQFLQEYRMVIFGPLLVVIVKFFPWGLAGGAQRLWEALKG